MALTIGIILVAMAVVAAFEIWQLWRLGERDQRRRRSGRQAAALSRGTERGASFPERSAARTPASTKRSRSLEVMS